MGAASRFDVRRGRRLDEPFFSVTFLRDATSNARVSVFRAGARLEQYGLMMGVGATSLRSLTFRVRTFLRGLSCQSLSRASTD